MERRAIGRVLSELSDAAHLPATGDLAVILPPVLRAFARYAPKARVWVCFTATDRTIVARAVFRELP